MVLPMTVQTLPLDGPRLYSAPKEMLIDLSVVIPVHNEEDNAVPLYNEVRKELDKTGLDWECIIVDDGSSDRTIERLVEAFAGDARLSVVGLRRNFGQTAGLAAGFDRARGKFIATMDGDLQNDPADIIKLMDALSEGRGYDVVSGWRKQRQDKFFSRRMPSMIANRLISKLTWTPIHDFGCAMKVYRREALQDVQLYGEMHRFLPALCVWKGARITERVVNHRARVAGTSKYGLVRTGHRDFAEVRMVLRERGPPEQQRARHVLWHDGAAGGSDAGLRRGERAAGSDLSRGTGQAALRRA